MKTFFFLLGISITFSSFGQSGYWQQRADYKIDVGLDVNTNIITGLQVIDYWNNSEDTLKQLFFHVYWNAFQPGSMMAESAPDYHKRGVLNSLSQNEIGFQKVKWITLNGKHQKILEHETILEVLLNQYILPHSKVKIQLAFEAQVPLEVRRAGRDNLNGVRYSMAQWYPKLCQYDKEGWHADPYCWNGEFYGVFGNFDVKITLDKNYRVAATGYLNPSNKSNNDKTIWHFTAPNVHDFVWAADTSYQIITRQIRNGPMINVVYVKNTTSYKRFKKSFPTIENFWKQRDSAWNRIADILEVAFPIIEKLFGKYPYRQYSVIQAGDGGMEYPMATLVRGPEIQMILHEVIHSWFYGIIATNETNNHWMDEGLTTWATGKVFQMLAKKNPNDPELQTVVENHTQPGGANEYAAYNAHPFNKQEPMATYSNYFNDKSSYLTAAYWKGTVFIEQLGYIVGSQMLERILLEYVNKWRFKHPNPNDFIRIAEKISGLQLGWYKMLWINTTKTIDYGIDSVWQVDNASHIRLINHGEIPMPVDLMIYYKDGSKELFYIPQYAMFGEKPIEDKIIPRKSLQEWKFTTKSYLIKIKGPLNNIEKIEIDPTLRMADIDRKNNTWPSPQ